MPSSRTVPLPALRERLASLEDPILRAISYRKDLPVNDRLYQARLGGLSRFGISLYRRELQRALARNYSNDERPLSKYWLPGVKRPLPDVTQDIRQGYMEFLHEICRAGDDPATYREAIVRDLDALWFLSDRIHHAGTNVGRTKLEDADATTLAMYQAAIRTRDVATLVTLLTDDDQQKAVIARVREKAPQSKLHPDVAEHLFRKLVFPVTLKAEALDLLLA